MYPKFPWVWEHTVLLNKTIPYVKRIELTEALIRFMTIKTLALFSTYAAISSIYIRKDITMTFFRSVISLQRSLTCKSLKAGLIRHYISALTFASLSIMITFSTGLCMDPDEIPAPLINPAGDLSLYQNLNYSKDSSLELQIPEGDALRTVLVQGETWYLQAAESKNQEAVRDQLRAYAESINGKIHHFDNYMAIFSVEENDTTLWWCKALIEYGMDLTIVKEFRLIPGRPATFKMVDEGVLDVRFHTDNPGGKFRSIIVTVPDGEVSLQAELTIRSGAYRRVINNKWYMASIRSNRFVIDDIPQEAGRCLFSLTSDQGNPLTDITVELVEYDFPVPKVEMGQKPGAIRIKNIPYGLAKVLPAIPFGTTTYTEHPEFPGGSGFENGDVTPEGDSFFLLPAGLWQVEVGPKARQKACALRALHIPVHSGKETLLDWPLAMTTVFGEEGDAGLRINRVKRSGDEVDVTFTLLGRDAAAVLPEPGGLEIKEGGAPAHVLGVERSPVPLEIVMLIDSSGSMKGQMKKALNATRKFIESLPEDASLRVVDFDTKPRPIKGKSRAEVLKGLKGVRANGATALNDSILMGLDMLQGADRPALLVFTDGFDANYNDTGPGSKATKKEVLDRVSQAGIPVFTIGFGKGHDVNTLNRISSLSGGNYYPASDPNALSDAFSVINSSLTSTFIARYKRPAGARPSDVPVVTFMVDISGSMDTTPDKSGCDYRIDKVKNLLHDFIVTLPDDILGQVMAFEDDVYVNQVTTSNKGELLTGVAQFYAGGGTNILGAVDSALHSQAAIPSNKRYMIFITDAALGVDEEKQIQFETLLGRLADENIQCLWVGIGNLNDQPFKRAAELSAGRYIITEDPKKLKQTFSQVTSDIKSLPRKTGDAETLIELTLRYRQKSGRNLTFANAAQALMPAPGEGAGIEIPASISYRIRPLKTRYDSGTASLVTGDAMPVRDARIIKRIPIGVSGKNQAALFTAKEALFLNRLKGLDAPEGSRFLSLVLEIRNVLPEQEVTVYPDGTSHPASWVGNEAATRGKTVKMVPTYVIPDMKRHLFLRWNSEHMVPLSPATWLTQAPLTMPGENSLAVSPEETVVGALVFMVPEAAMHQMSLHFYDMNYGHFDLPLVGTLPLDPDRISDLPAKPPSELSKTFALAIREVRDVEKIGRHEAGSDAIFRIVEADMISKVQALLDIRPAERFSLRMNTREGALPVRLHNLTGLLPLGFMAPTMLAPGSNNRIRLVFRVPGDIAAEAGKGELVVDVKGGGVVIPLDEQAEKAPVVPSPADSLKGDGIDLKVNRIERYRDSEDMFVADLTLFDARDGKATAMTGAFILKKKGFTEKRTSGTQMAGPELTRSKGLASFAAGNAIIPVGIMPPDSVTEQLIFGITDETVIPDGRSLRGLVVFKLPFGDTDPADWELTSPLFKDLKAELGDGIYSHERLLAERMDIDLELSDSYIAALNEAVACAKRRHESQNIKRPGAYKPKQKRFDNEAPPAESVPVPDFVQAGALSFKDIRDIEALRKRLCRIRFLPSRQTGWAHMFAPEAVMAQSWGTEGDFARMAEIVLARQGFAAERSEVLLTEKGREALAARAGLVDVELEKLPALSYRDPKGLKYVLVAPFMEHITRLKGLVKPVEPYEISLDPQGTTITVSLLAIPIQEGQNQAARDLSNGLAGESDSDEPASIYMLTANPSLPELSRGAVDIGYTVVGFQNGPVVKAIFEGVDKRVIGSEIIDTGQYNIVGERIEISMGSETVVLENSLEEKEQIVDRFHTLGINLPDLNQKGLEALDEAMEKRHGTSEAPSNLSALRWFTRNLIYRFVCAQSRYENEIAEKLDLLTGRNERPRCVAVSVRKSARDKSLITTIDLARTVNQVHEGTRKAMLDRAIPDSGPTEEAKHAFNIMSGIYASKLEESVLPRGGSGFFGMLARYPADTRLMWLSANDRYQFYDSMREQGYPERMIRLLEESPNVALFPSKPAIIRGKPHWAWLEVNPNTFETISMLHTGDRGAMVERVFSDLWKDGLDFIVGGLVGVSSSIWSVSAFSLQMSDYKEIMAAAKKFALGIADNFGATIKVGDFEFKAKPGDSKPEASYTGTGSGAVGTYKNLKGLYDMAKDPKIDLGGFEGGFKAGVEHYFSSAVN